MDIFKKRSTAFIILIICDKNGTIDVQKREVFKELLEQQSRNRSENARIRKKIT